MKHIKRFSNGSTCCLLSQLVTFKYCNPCKASLIRSLYVIVSSGVIFCSSSANLLRSSKNIRVDLLEGPLFDASIVESGQLPFNHCFHFLSVYQVYLPKSCNCISTIWNLNSCFSLNMHIFYEYQHFLWI